MPGSRLAGGRDASPPGDSATIGNDLIAIPAIHHVQAQCLRKAGDG
ncbi:hypothetical protein ASZ90_016175 [hydrocarbon metagenome]|uniref:Uncharacterized protein n=1 Tax=hydrocarbon metagenome TaxID=938273 RepID=A0A0W8EZY3_9ZZZZ